jgi:hypothetical protein
MPQVFLSWEKISKTTLEKVFFFILRSFFLIWGFVPKTLKNGTSERYNFFLEIGHIKYQKNKNVMLI